MQVSYDFAKLSEISSIVSIVLINEDAQLLKSEFDRNLIQNSNVEGFRKGKAPLHVIVNKYGRDKYYKDLRVHRPESIRGSNEER
jgi:FKBP-type peptidyl-prolyl cis-trans isomerase (trigger factor)